MMDMEWCLIDGTAHLVADGLTACGLPIDGAESAEPREHVQCWRCLEAAIAREALQCER
jgi:hypothetical protein